MNCYRYLVSIIMSMNITTNVFAQVTGELDFEQAYGFDPQKFNKSEGILKLEFEGYVDDLSYTIIPKIYVDLADDLRIDKPNFDNYSQLNRPFHEDQHSAIELSEAYVDFNAFNGIWRIGKQQVVWGQADGLKVLDLVNPQNFREFNLDDFDDSRIPTWIINGDFSINDFSTLQVLIIPDTTFNKLADDGTTYQITSQKLRPQRTELPPNSGLTVTQQDIDRPAGEIELGLRWRAFYSGWDLTLNYLDHYHDNPVVFRRLLNNEVLISPSYQKNDLFGLTASNAFGDAVVRLELGYNTTSYHITDNLQNGGIAESPELNSVVGLDYQGFTDWLISYQWFISVLTDYQDDILRNETRFQHTLLLRKNALNETLTLELFTLYNDEDQDGQIRVEVAYQWTDEITLSAGVDTFFGKEEGVFGQFKETDRIVFGFKYGF